MLKQRIKYYLQAALTAQNVLFHTTSMYNALEILKDGHFNLTSSLGVKSETEKMAKNKLFYLSTGRSLRGRYNVSRLSMGYATFVIDRSKLQHTVKPIDYFDGLYIKDQHIQSKNQDETEDRIYSHTQHLSLSAVSNISVGLGGKYIDSKDWLRLRKLILAAHRAGIKIYLFKNAEYMIMQKLDKAVNPKEILEDFRQEPERPYGGGNKHKEFSAYWRELYYKKDISELSKWAFERLKMIMHDNFNDAETALSSDLHNARQNPKEIDKLVKMFRQAGTQDYKELLKIIKDKWRPIYKKYYQKIEDEHQARYQAEMAKRALTDDN